MVSVLSLSGDSRFVERNELCYTHTHLLPADLRAETDETQLDLLSCPSHRRNLGQLARMLD